MPNHTPQHRNSNKNNTCRGGTDADGNRCPCEWGLHICPEDKCCDYNYIFTGGCYSAGGNVVFDYWNDYDGQWVCGEDPHWRRKPRARQPMSSYGRGGRVSGGPPHLRSNTRRKK